MSGKNCMKWKKIAISTDSIEIRTPKAVLIRMPKGSDYAGFMFWHPSKLVEQCFFSVEKISYTDDFEFKLFKNGKGRFNYNKKIAEKTISAAEMRKAMESMDLTIPDPYELHTPELIDPVEVEVLEELKDE